MMIDDDCCVIFFRPISITIEGQGFDFSFHANVLIDSIQQKRKS
jgi:hypothetical protein